MPGKILIIRFSSIGDIVLTTPVIRALKQQTGVQVHYLTKPAFASIVRHNPHVDRVWEWSDDPMRLIRQLRQEHFDFVVDLHHNLRTRRIKLALRVKSASFPKLNIEKWLLVNLKVNRLPDVHIVDRYMQTVESRGATNDGEGLDFFIPAEKRVDVKSRFGIVPYHFVALVIGAAHNTKSLTLDQLIRLCGLIQQPVLLIGGKGEVDKGKIIQSSCPNDRVRSAVGELDILQSASVIEQAQHIITPDTGMMHIAAALKKEQTVVWGNTIPGFGMYPYYGKHAVPWRSFEIQGLPCRPCSKIGFEKCPKGHFKCMLLQDIIAIAKTDGLAE